MILKSSSVVKLWLNDIERGDEKNTFELEDIKDYNNLPTLNYKLDQHLKYFKNFESQNVERMTKYHETMILNGRYGEIIFNDSWPAAGNKCIVPIA